MMPMIPLWTALLTSPALAGDCEAKVTAGLSKQGDALVEAYGEVIQCDAEVAQASFEDFMKASGDVQTLVSLSMTAIHHDLFTEVWEMIEKVAYSDREEVAAAIGVRCEEEPKVIAFLQGGYYGLRPVQFDQWKPALAACKASDVSSWLEKTVGSPPGQSFDEKYFTMVNAYVAAQRTDALTVLQEAAIESAGKGGPFNQLIDAMDQAVRPNGFGDPSDEDRAKLEAAWIAVANKAGPEKAALVADRLYVNEAEEKAASLLPVVYPDRVQEDGTMMYGVAAIESCEGDAIIHYATVTEPARRWSIVEAVEEPARAFKSKLKCSSEEPWPVVVTGQPIASESELGPWVDELVAQWEEQGLDVKTKSQKVIELP